MNYLKEVFVPLPPSPYATVICLLIDVFLTQQQQQAAAAVASVWPKFPLSRCGYLPFPPSPSRGTNYNAGRKYYTIIISN